MPTAPDFVSLIWDPLRPECPTDPPEILLGGCDDRQNIGWLEHELHTLRDKGVECLSGLPQAFVLQPRENSKTGVKNFYLNIYDSTKNILVGNVWFQSDELHISDHTRNPYPQATLNYSRNGVWWLLHSGWRVPVL